MSVAYRERERDRYEDSRTSVSSARRDTGYTTVKRYVVKDEDARSSYGRDRRNDRGAERVEETRIVRREREVDEPPVRDLRRDDLDRRDRRDDAPRISQTELVIRREDDTRRDRDYGYDRDRRRDDISTDRELVIRRTSEREDSRLDELALRRYGDGRDSRDYTGNETRYRGDYEVLAPNRDRFDDRDIQRYTRSTEYYAPQPPPQTIVIRQEPIIIRERVRDDDYQIVRKSDVEEEKSVVRREPDRPPQPREEEYFYEKKVRERIDEPRREDRERDREDDFYERKSMRREVSPHDSVSQVGRRRSQDYSSDDSMVYVRKEVKETSRDASPERRKNLAAGVIAGVGAAELLRNHKKKEGRDTSHGAGRLGRDLGAGALGAIAAEGISRARSLHRSRSRRRERERDDSSDDSRRRSRSRSRTRRRSRSESQHRLRNLGAIGLGAAALATAVAVAKRRNDKNNDDGGRVGRSHSRNRISETELANDPTADDARNPKHRNIRMAEAGAAGAAITALIDRARSKSRGGKERSRSRVRQGLPVLAAGLGSAALAGLYEKNKAKKEAEAIAHDERRARSRSRSRARSDAYYDGPSQGAVSDPGLIEYGDGPMYGNNFGAGYYGRPQPQESFYGPQTAVVPAAAAGAAYAATGPREARSRSVSRDRRDVRSGSRSLSPSDDGRHHRRHHSRDRAAEEAAAAGAGVAAATERERRKAEKHERRARKREEQYQRDQYEREQAQAGYIQPGQPYGATPPPPIADPYAAQTGFYSQSSQLPPPPGGMPQQYPIHAQAGAPGPQYTPQDFPPPPSQPPPGVAPGYEAYASGANPYAQHRGTDENVSPAPNPPFGNSFPYANDQFQSAADGLSTTRAAPGFAPSINVQPPSVTDSPVYSTQNPNLTVPNSYIPPTERSSSPLRSSSQPPSSSGTRKSVQFAESPSGAAIATPLGEVEPNPESSRHRHRSSRSDEIPVNDDQRSRDMPLPDDDGRRKHRHHRRRSSHDPSSRSIPNNANLAPERMTSPASDATEELPTRFDNQGQKKSETGDDPLADRLDDILAGKGTAGKMFGNFMSGVFGPEGRKRR